MCVCVCVCMCDHVVRFAARSCYSCWWPEETIPTNSDIWFKQYKWSSIKIDKQLFYLKH